MKRRRILYGWLPSPGRYCLGKNPPDFPCAPHITYSSMSAAETAALERKASVIWCGAALAEKERSSLDRRLQQ